MRAIKPELYLFPVKLTRKTSNEGIDVHLWLTALAFFSLRVNIIEIMLTMVPYAGEFCKMT